MGLDEFTNQAAKAYGKNGLRGAFQHSVLQVWNRSLTRVGERLPYNLLNGTNVYQSDWDVLILLDACRPDALSDVATEFEFLPDRSPVINSVGTNSPSWIANTFNQAPPSELEDTLYVSANGHTRILGEDAPPKEKFLDVIEVWRTGWSEELGLIPPRAATNAAVQASQQYNSHERMIVHYMQPHIPYPSLDFTPDQQGESFWTVWNELMCGSISREESFDAYLDTLRWVLRDVALLLSVCEFDRPIISADHGELFGEYGIYGHTPFPLPTLQQVPWVELETPIDGLEKHVTDADIESIEEDITASQSEPDSDEDGDVDVDQQLRALGYKV